MGFEQRLCEYPEKSHLGLAGGAFCSSCLPQYFPVGKTQVLCSQKCWKRNSFLCENLTVAALREKAQEKMNNSKSGDLMACGK